MYVVHPDEDRYLRVVVVICLLVIILAMAWPR